MASYNWNWPSVKITTGALQYSLNGSATSVSQDTVTPANSKPLPVQNLDTTGVRINPATSDNQTTEITKLNSIDTKTPALVSGRVPVDGSGVTQPVSGTVSVNNFPATQPVSGTVTANQGTGGASAWKVDGSAVTQPVSAASLPLPTGASTAANQSTGNTSLATIATNTGNIPTVGQKTSAASLPIVIASDQAAFPVKMAGKSAINKSRNDYTSTSVTTAAYVQILASTAAAVTEIEIFDSSGQTLVLATGGAGSEVDQIYITPGGNGRVPLAIAASTRVAIKAVSATANAGEIDVNFYG